MEETVTHLKVELLNADLPAYAIAAKCGIHPSKLSRYALGKDPIKAKHLRALCKYFKVDQSYLLGSSTFEVKS